MKVSGTKKVLPEEPRYMTLPPFKSRKSSMKEIFSGENIVLDFFWKTGKREYKGKMLEKMNNLFSPLHLSISTLVWKRLQWYNFKTYLGTLLHCGWECKLVQTLWKRVWRFLKKLKIELPHDSAIPSLGIYPEKIMVQKDTCTSMITAELFTMAKIRYGSNHHQQMNG